MAFSISCGVYGSAENIIDSPSISKYIPLPLHPYELTQIHYTVVRVAKGQMGIGGDDSWGAYTHQEYLLNADGKMEFSFSFKGI